MDGGALTGFARDQQARGLAKGTIDRRRRVLISFSLSLTDGDLLRAGEQDVLDWLDSCNLSPGSRYVYISHLHAFYTWARRTNLRADDPTAEIPRPRLRRRYPRPVDDRSAAFALDNADPRMRCWLLLFAYEGFRCADVAHLRGEQVMTDRDPPVLFVADGKGHKEALLPLHPEVELALRDYGLPRRGWVFTKGDGRPYLPGTISTYVSRYLHSLGIEATAHQWRHWFGTAVWSASKDLRVTQELMRHSDPKTTTVYTAWDAPLATSTVRKLRLPSHGRTLPLDWEETPCGDGGARDR